MNNPNVEQLENTISAYVNTVYKEVPPTEEEFKEKAELLRKSNELLMPVSDDEFNEIFKENIVPTLKDDKDESKLLWMKIDMHY